MLALKHGVGQTPGTGPSAVDPPTGNSSWGLLVVGVSANREGNKENLAAELAIERKFESFVMISQISTVLEWNSLCWILPTVIDTWLPHACSNIRVEVIQLRFGLIQKTNKVNLPNQLASFFHGHGLGLALAVR